MRIAQILFTVVLASVFTFSCSDKNKNQATDLKEAKKVQKHLIVYGSSDCHVCVDFKKKLDSAQIEYEFRDVMDTVKKYDEEMLNKLNNVGFRGYVRFPVVDIEGRIMVKPGFEYVVNALH